MKKTELIRLIESEINKQLVEIELPKMKWVRVTSKSDINDLKDRLLKLINIAYSDIGGHVNFKTPDDILDPELTFWQVIDMDGDNEPDAAIFGKHSFGIKQTGMGHDGQKATTRELLKHKSDLLKNNKHWVEVSGKIAEIYMNKFHVPVINDPEIVKRLMKGKPIKWIGKIKGKSGDGWYSRKLAGHTHEKIIVGMPMV